MDTYDRRSFRIEINSLEEFAAFVMLIRGGKDLNEQKLQELTAKLRTATKALSDAEQADANRVQPLIDKPKGA